MGVTVGEVNAVLKAKDEMSAVYEKVTKASEDLGKSHEQASHHVQSFGEQFEGLATRLAERLAIYEVIKTSINFAKEAIESTAALYDMSRASGVATDDLQKLSYAGKEFGINMELMVRSIEMFSAKLARGDKNATDAVSALGLSVKDLIAQGPKEAFLQFTEAASRLQDPMSRNAIYAEALSARFGRLLAAVGDLRGEMEKVPKGALIGPEQVEHAHNLEVAWDHLWTKAKVLAVGAFDVAYTFKQGLAHWIDAEQKTIGLDKGLKDIVLTMDRVAPATTKVITNIDLMTNRILHLREDAMTPISVANQKLITELHGLGDTAADLAKALNLPEVAVAHFIAEQKKAAEEQKKFAAAMLELNTAGDTWKKTLQGIDGAVVEAVKHYLEAGVSHAALARAYDLSATQIKAVASELKAEVDARKLAAKTTEEHTKLMAEYYDIVAKNSMSTTGKQIADIHKWADDLVATQKKAGTDTAQFYADVARISAEKLSVVGVNMTELDTMSQAHFRNIAEAARATYQYAMGHSNEFTSKGLETLHQKMLEAQGDWRNWKDKADEALDAAISKSKILLDALKKAHDAGGSQTYDFSTDAGWQQFIKDNPTARIEAGAAEYLKSHTLAQAIAAGIINLYAGLQGLGGGLSSIAKPNWGLQAAEGLVGDFGAGTPVTLHGKEAVIPLGTGLGNAMVNHFYVNGTGEEIARVVSETLMRQLKTIRHFGAA